MTRVPVNDLAAAHSDLADELEAAVRRVLRSGSYIRGPEVERFEHDFARYCGVAGAVGVASGLDALMLTLEGLGIGAGDEVLVSAHTSIATWLAITHAGARPVPVEPDPRTMLIDPARVESAIGPRTAAIIAVHLYGTPADMDALAAIAERHRLRVIEDASQAHGARLRGRPVGSLSVAGAFSLYPTKNLGAIGDAGIVVSGDPELLDRIRMLSNYGERERHRSELRGRNSRLDELQAALLSVKLEKLEAGNARRRSRAEQYLRELSGCPGVEVPRVPEYALGVWHQFVVRVAERDRVREVLARRGIDTLVHYPVPPHRSPAYASDYPDPLPITEELAGSVLSLPISPQLSEEACARVCEELLATVAAVAA
ncbi:MAG TPA: DegT/DnrJ/EryC1/StrS family aminotransferase [Solirubrobacteraceae bacterium]|nr:DegT/DnrJ/EryC1/StrS family aminotransferase [Solirubrobacteraceae bacterium]